MFARVFMHEVLQSFTYLYAKMAIKSLALRIYLLSQLIMSRRKKGTTGGRPFSAVALLVEIDSPDLF